MKHVSNGLRLLCGWLLLFECGSAPDWVPSGDFQYLHASSRLSRYAALAYCHAQKPGAFLVRPTTHNAEFLKQFAREEFNWADHHAQADGSWRWSDGTPLVDVTWIGGYPKHDSEWPCGVYQRSSASIYNYECSASYGVECQAPLDITTQPPTTTQHTITPPTTTQPTTTPPTTTQPTTTQPTTTQPTTTPPTTTQPTTIPPTTTQPTTTEPTTTQPTTTPPTTTQPTTIPPTTTQPTTTQPTTTQPTTTPPTTTQPTTIPPTTTQTTITQPTTTQPTTTLTTATPTPITDRTTTPSPSTSTVPPLDCPVGPGWTDLGTADNRCYYFSSADPAAVRADWTGAFVACSIADATLASLPDVGTFYAAEFVVRRWAADAWTGLLDAGGHKSWQDGTAYDPALDQFVEADADPATFGYLSAGDGLLHVDDGSEKRAYICSVDLTPEPTTTEPQPTTTTAPATTLPPCSAPWQQYDQTCYLFSNDTQLWSAAGHSCHEQDGELVSVHDANVLLFLLLQSGDTVYWTGLQQENDTFAWEDGSDATNVQTDLGVYLDDWSVGKNCVAMSQDGYPKSLVHKDCFSEYNYVCYKDVNENGWYY